MFAEIPLDVGHFVQAWLVPVIAVNVYVHWYMVNVLSKTAGGRRQHVVGGSLKPIDSNALQTIIVSGTGGLGPYHHEA